MLAILLAAGKGQRLGGPKALLELGGRTALERCHGLLRAAGLERIRIVVSPAVAQALGLGVAPGGPPASRTGESLDERFPGADWVVNPAPERGQTSSLRCALERPGPGEDFVLHTVDHPLVRPQDVRALLAAFERRHGAQSVVAPSVRGRRGHPCVHAAALGQEFLALPDDAPAHAVIRADPTRVLHVPMDDPWLVHDLDTPDDLLAARAALAADPGSRG